MRNKRPIFEYEGRMNLRKGKTEMSWEESALRPDDNLEGFVRPDKQKWATLVVPVLALVFFGVIFLKLGSLQIVEGARYRDLAEGNRLRERPVLAPRGFVKDRYGQMLAQNTVSFRLVAVPLDLPKEGLEDEISSLADTLGLDKQNILDIVAKTDRKSFEPVVIEDDISQEQSILFETKSAEFIGFQVQSIPIRDYVDAPVFSHILGYTGRLNEQESQDYKDKDYSTQDFIGKIGIEKQYEDLLRGVNGHEQIEVDAAGRVVKVLGSVDPKPGNILELSIDKELQERLYNQLKSKGVKGAAVAMDPKTGQVLALVSIPGFDNNLFAHGIKQQDYSVLINDPNLPLFNRAIAGVYPPGSTVKPMVAAAALEEGVVDEKTVIVDRGVLVIPNQYDSRISYNFYGWKRDGLGPMTATSAIARSSDIYFYTVAGGHPSSPVQGMGAEKIAHYYKLFGMGKETGIDLQGEKPGLVADPEWKAEYYKNDSIMSQWYLGNTYHVGIGQGDMLATPLQMAFTTSVIANNGKGMKPTLFLKEISQSGRLISEAKPQQIVDLPISQENLKIAQEGMRETVLYGSGVQLKNLPIEAAGKTGTSQFDGSDPSRTHAWFISYAPFNDPQIVITVLVEAGGEGHAVAVPVVKDALDWWANTRYNK